VKLRFSSRDDEKRRLESLKGKKEKSCIRRQPLSPIAVCFDAARPNCFESLEYIIGGRGFDAKERETLGAKVKGRNVLFWEENNSDKSCAFPYLRGGKKGREEIKRPPLA